MSKGSNRRPEDKKKFDEGYDKAFKKRYWLRTVFDELYEFHSTPDKAYDFFYNCGDRAYDYGEITEPTITYPRCDISGDDKD